MANIKEIAFEEQEIYASLVHEALCCLVHSVLFLRNPDGIRPEDCECVQLYPLVYVKIGGPDADVLIKEKVSSFLNSLIQISPTTKKGTFVISFFERRPIRKFLIINDEERVHFERWKFPMIINDDIPMGNDEYQFEGRRRAYDAQREEIEKRMFRIVEVSKFQCHEKL